jgi:hypothetical protein
VDELSLHILDIVYNSIEAGATRIDVEIVESTSVDSLLIRIADNGRGMDEEMVRRVFDPFVTTRTTRKVGLGLSLLKANAEACNGQVELESKIGVGTVVTASFQLSHIDRQPLGDMKSTLMVLMTSRPEIDFRYRQVKDGRVFELSLAEIRTELDDVPITHPAVLRWLGDYIDGGLRSLEKRGAREAVPQRA